MGLYSDSPTIVSVLASTVNDRERIQSQLKSMARAMHAHPPPWGAYVAATVLGDPIVHNAWLVIWPLPLCGLAFDQSLLTGCSKSRRCRSVYGVSGKSCMISSRTSSRHLVTGSISARVKACLGELRGLSLRLRAD